MDNPALVLVKCGLWNAAGKLWNIDAEWVRVKDSVRVRV